MDFSYVVKKKKKKITSTPCTTFRFTHTHQKKKKKSTPVLLKGHISNLVFTVSQEVEKSDSHKIMQRRGKCRHLSEAVIFI